MDLRRLFFLSNVSNQTVKLLVKVRFPQNKLVMGVPFYGTTGTAGEQVTYYDLINKVICFNTSVDEWMYNGERTIPPIVRLQFAAYTVCVRE